MDQGFRGHSSDRPARSYDAYGERCLYFSQTPVHVGPSLQLEWLIERSAQLELMPLPPNEDEDRWVDTPFEWIRRELGEFLG